jgi:hypothetical protein
MIVLLITKTLKQNYVVEQRHFVRYNLILVIKLIMKIMWFTKTIHNIIEEKKIKVIFQNIIWKKV